MNGHNNVSSVSIAVACQSGFTFCALYVKLQPFHALFAAPC